MSDRDEFEAWAWKAWKAARRWMPISEAPDDYVVLMCDEHGNRWTGVYPAHDGACGYPATHFQYLPEPPSE